VTSANRSFLSARLLGRVPPAESVVGVDGRVESREGGELELIRIGAKRLGVCGGVVGSSAKG
jgi:hypothetical protein